MPAFTMVGKSRVTQQLRANLESVGRTFRRPRAALDPCYVQKWVNNTQAPSQGFDWVCFFSFATKITYTVLCNSLSDHLHHENTRSRPEAGRINHKIGQHRSEFGPASGVLARNGGVDPGVGRPSGEAV